MRILILVHGYPPTFNGGAEFRAERTVRSLVERGHAVQVLCVESVSLDTGRLPYVDGVQEGARIRRLSFATPPELRPASWEYDNPETAAATEQLIKQFRPDVIHLFSGYLMTGSVVRQARAAGVPIIISLTDFWWLCHRITLLRSDGSRCNGPTPAGCARCQSENYRRFRLPARAWPQSLDLFWKLSSQSDMLSTILNMPDHAARLATNLEALNMADALIAPSQHLADTYVQYGADSGKVRVWRQGVELDRCSVRQPSSTLRVGYLGQVKYHKGVDLLIDAWSRLRGPTERELVLYGSDTGEPGYGQKLRRQIARLPDVTWNAPIDRRAVWDALANLDVVVVPSRWVENSPNIILESQAVGAIVVGTNLGGIAELVQHEVNGLLFEPDNVADLAGQLQRLLDEPHLLADLRRVRAPFQNLAAEIDRIESLYESLTSPVDQDQPASISS